MEALPYIDEHERRIAAPVPEVWRALLATVRSFGAGFPGALTAAWGLEPSKRTGDWSSDVAIGDTIVGFGVVAVSAPRALVLRGGHRFSRYELRFEITGSDEGPAVLHARTSAVFPGPHGSIYRALVIASGGHRLAVPRLLARVAQRVGRQAAA